MERDPENEYGLFCADDGVLIFDSEKDAARTKEKWEKSGANNIQGPYTLARSEMDKAAPAMLARLKRLEEIGRRAGRISKAEWLETLRLVERVEKIVNEEQAGNRLVIHVEGGLVQAVYCNVVGEVEVIDLDNEELSQREETRRRRALKRAAREMREIA